MDPEGIEPSPFPCEGNALPLSYGPLIVAGAGIAPAPRAYETRVVLLHHPALSLLLKLYQNLRGFSIGTIRTYVLIVQGMFLVNNQIIKFS